MTLSTYLNFNGNCREVFEFYRSVFGGDFANVETFENAPSDAGLPESDKNRIMHMSLPIGESVLMGSDVASQAAPAVVTGTNFSISYTPESKEAANTLFAKMSEGGMVTMPLGEMFWGGYFGSCTDKFGINWQFNYEPPQE